MVKGMLVQPFGIAIKGMTTLRKQESKEKRRLRRRDISSDFIADIPRA